MMHLRTRAVGGWLVSLFAMVVVAIVPLSARRLDCHAAEFCFARRGAGVGHPRVERCHLSWAAGGWTRTVRGDSGREPADYLVRRGLRGEWGDQLGDRGEARLTITGGPDFEGIAYTGPRGTACSSARRTRRRSANSNWRTPPCCRRSPYPASLRTISATAGSKRCHARSTATRCGPRTEEALTIDGPASTQAVGTLVRLQQMTDDGASVGFGPQYVYQVDPIHAGSNPDRSGLPDLVMLPDDTLLTLERSRIGTGLSTSFRNRIYEVSVTGATDVSGPTFASGLIGARLRHGFKGSALVESIDWD